MRVDRAELRKVSYLDVDALGERDVKLMPLWDGNQWHLWVPQPKGLTEMTSITPVHSDYLGMGAATDSDLFIPFIDFMWQRASWPDVSSRIQALSRRFHQMFASVAKMRHVHRTRIACGLRAAPFALTEVEYLSIVARSVFDLLQEIIACIWGKRICLLDAEAERKRRHRKLPRSYARIALANDIPRTPGEISTTFFLTKALSHAYAQQAPFFAALRKFRDDIVHGLSEPPVIFVTEKGICVDRRIGPFDKFSVWHDCDQYNANLVSIVPWLAHVALQTIESCTLLIDAFAPEIRFPNEVAPGYRIYVRAVNGDVVPNLLKASRGEPSWWDDE